MTQNNFKIAITGGIGSGKSTAVNIIKDLGYPVFSCDQITAELYKNQRVLRGIKKLFPTAVKGFFRLSADKKEIARIVFNDKEKYNALNDFLMPEILNRLFSSINGGSGVVFAEVPLLFERNLSDKFDAIMVVMRNENDRINSVIARSNLSKSEVLERINSQFDYDNFAPNGEIVINNDGDIENLKQQITTAISTVIKA